MTPDVVGRMLDLIGQATAGAALFLTGVILSAQRLRINLGNRSLPRLAQ